MMTISMTLPLIVGKSKISIYSIKKILPVTAYKSSDNLAKQVNTPTAMMSLSWSMACHWCRLSLKSAVYRFVKPLTKCTAIAKKALTKTNPYINTCRYSSSQTAQIPAILPIPPSAAKTALTLP